MPANAGTPIGLCAYVAHLPASYGSLSPNVSPCPFVSEPLPSTRTANAMTATLLKRPLQLTLHPQDILPEGMSWRLHEGYVRAATWDLEGESITLGLWGAGDVISSEDPGLNPLELQCLTTVVIEHIELEPELHRSQLRRERQMLAELNLTHKALAELCGLTRVTVTKLLSRYWLEGQLVPVSNNDLLIPRLS